MGSLLEVRVTLGGLGDHAMGGWGGLSTRRQGTIYAMVPMISFYVFLPIRVSCFRIETSPPAYMLSTCTGLDWTKSAPQERFDEDGSECILRSI